MDKTDFVSSNFDGSTLYEYDRWNNCFLFVTILLVGVVLSWFAFYVIHRVKLIGTTGYVPMFKKVNINHAIAENQKQINKTKYNDITNNQAITERLIANPATNIEVLAKKDTNAESNNNENYDNR